MSNGHRAFLKLSAFLVSVSLLGTLSGCTDVLTYSKDAERDGLKYYNQGLYTEAAGSFRNAVRQEPRRYSSYYYMGQCYLKSGQYQQSVQAFKSCLDTIALSTEGHNDKTMRMNALDGLAQAAAKSSDKDREIGLILQKAQSTQSAQDYFVLAKIHRYSGDADAALDAYNRAALLAPDDFMIAKEFGLYLEQLGQGSKADIALRRAYQLKPSDKEVADAMRRLGVVPGPSIKDEKSLARPVIPQGPIPEIDLAKKPKTTAAEPGTGSVATPRD